MTETPIVVPFPTSPYCQVRARVASIWADGPDDGTHPDWRPATGEKVALTPSIGSQLLTYDVGGADPIIVTVERVDCVVGDDGLLAKSDGRPVYIAPTDDPLLSATGWTWTASIKGKSVVFAAPTGGVVDLAVFIAAPATDDTKVWVERLPELITAGANAVDAADRAEAAANLTRETNIEIGTVTTGAAGSSASASIVGEAPDFTLNLGIPKGDPGGWNTASAIPTGTNLDTIKAAGMYYVPGSHPDNDPTLGYPIAGFSGSLEVYSYGTTYVRQRATGRDFDTAMPDTVSRNAWERTFARGVWSPWINLNLDGSLSAREIYAPGRPDIATTTPYTNAQLNSIPSGHKYISLDGPQGAWEWRKRGSTWVCVEGDTGWRVLGSWGTDGNVVGTRPTNTTPTPDTAGVFRVRRINERVMWELRGLTAVGSVWWSLHPGLAAEPHQLVPLTVESGETRTAVFTNATATRVTLASDIIPGSNSTILDHLAPPSWPTTLPGSPA